MSGAAATGPGGEQPGPWDRVLDWSGSVRAVAVLRLAMGPITLLHLRPFLRDARHGVGYDDHYWEPFAAWMPHVPDRVWFAVLWVGAGAAVLMTVGLATRLTTVATLLAVAANLLLSQTHFRHNRAFLVILLGGLALLPAGRVLAVDAWLRRRRRRRRATVPPDPATDPAIHMVPLWPLWLLRVQVCLVYLASGTSKLVDSDWFGGLVLWDRVVRYRHVLEPTPLPAWATDLLTERWLYYGVGPAAVLTELFVGIGLLLGRTRLAAIWVALVFHALIEVSASVEVFSFAAIAALAIWVTPATRDRVVYVGGPATVRRSVSALVRAIDWFGRFRVVPAGDGEPRLSVVDRDGTTHTGRAAVALLLSRLPVTFPLGAPLLVIPARHRRRVARRLSPRMSA